MEMKNMGQINPPSSKERSSKKSHHHHHQVPEVKIQIDSSSRASSSHNHRAASSEGTLTENSSLEAQWNREPKQSKTFIPKPARKATFKVTNLDSSHSFLADATDMRSMETALMQLVNDFHSGKLQAFGRHCSTDQMEAIRDQQEKLARLHFDLGAQQDINTQHNTNNMTELVNALEHLSQTIEQLHPHGTQSQSDSS